DAGRGVAGLQRDGAEPRVGETAADGGQLVEVEVSFARLERNAEALELQRTVGADGEGDRFINREGGESGGRGGAGGFDRHREHLVRKGCAGDEVAVGGERRGAVAAAGTAVAGVGGGVDGRESADPSAAVG